MYEQPQAQPVSPEPKRSGRLLRDIIGIVFFVIAVVAGAYLLNNYIFQTYNVFGPSMEPTLETGDRLIVNKSIVSWQRIKGGEYLPPRGQVIVFVNPLDGSLGNEEHLVKRTIGLPGERVVVEDGLITIFNDEFPNGFNPDDNLDGPKSPTSGTADITVPEGEIFVSGDNRIENFSLDSRNGLSTVPLELIEGPVYARLFPFTEFRLF